MGIGAPPRVIFMGTPAFAVPTLEAMLSAGYLVLEVVTQPDRPKGRRHELAQSPVKIRARERDIPVFQPERIRRPEAMEHLRSLAPDLMVVVGYGQIIPQAVIDVSTKGIINVHASLLPQLRGAAPIQWAIARGNNVTGVTTMKIDAGLDTGDMLMKSETQIGPDEDALELAERLALMGAALLVQTVDALGTIVPEKQDEAMATLARILKKEDGRIDWRRSAREIHNQVRGMKPWPGAHTILRGHLWHLWRARALDQTTDVVAGTLMPGRTARIACGGGTILEALEVQMEGRGRVSADAFMNGLRLTGNESLN